MQLEKALRWVVLVGVFALPFVVLYVSRSLFFPFITGKNFAFRIIVEIIAGGWLALALSNPAYRPKKQWLLWAFGAFVLIIFAADLFGVYPHKSLWSNFERMDGWVTLIHLFVYFLVAQSILTTERLWKAWWHTSFAVSGLVGMYGLFQLLGFITINQGGVRLDATFGNATYLGVYMLFIIFLAALYLAREWVEKKTDLPQYFPYYIAGALQIPATMLAFNDVAGGGKFGAFLLFTLAIWLFAWARSQRTGIARGSLIALILLDAFVLFFTSTRGAILGLIGGGALAALILIILAPRSRIARRSGIAIAGLGVVAILFWLLSGTAFVQKVEPLQRLASIAQEGFPLARRLNVEMAWQGFKERPLLGWGQENYAPVFDKYYLPEMYAQEPWFDRVHNIVFDWLIAGGVLGLLAYLSLYVFALLAIWRSSAFERYEKAVLTGLLAGYFFYLIFTFDNVTSYILFASLLAYIAVRASAQEKPLFEARAITRTASPYIAFGLAVVTCGVAWYVNAEAIAQNRAIIAGLTTQQGGAAENLKYFEKALSYDSVGNQEVREQFSQAAISVIGAQGVAQDVQQTFAQEALQGMVQQSNDAPLYARFPFFIGILLDRAGAYADAKTALDKAHELSPGKQSILFELGLNAFARNAPQEAVAAFKQAYESEPAYNEAERFYVVALLRTNQDATAAPILQKLIDNDEATDQRIAAAFAEDKNYTAIIQIWSAHAQKHPEDTEARLFLASAYYTAGQKAAALKELNAIKTEYPSTSDKVNQAIQAVNSGK